MNEGREGYSWCGVADYSMGGRLCTSVGGALSSTSAAGIDFLIMRRGEVNRK